MPKNNPDPGILEQVDGFTPGQGRSAHKAPIPLSAPQIQGKAWEYVKECLDTGWVSSAGRFVNQFEDALAGYIGCRHAAACINGTAALHVALKVLGIKLGEEVLVPALTFIAPANAVCYVGAYPVFIDIDPQTWQMDPQKVVDFLTKECQAGPDGPVNRHTGRCVKAILPVHILGHPVDMDPVVEAARRFGLKVIEDATESLGATYKGAYVGTFGDVACFSFNGNKIITTGQGGMLVTDQESIARKARYLITQAKDDAVESIHNEIGFNYRLSNIQAALGLAQMDHLTEFVEKKRKIAAWYRQGLKGLPGIGFPVEREWAAATFWLSTVRVDKNSFGSNSRELGRFLSENSVETRPLWCPLPRLNPFAHCYAYKIEVADKIYADGLSLPSSAGLTQEDQDQVIDLVRNAQKTPGVVSGSRVDKK